MLQASILTACMALFLALLFMWTSVDLVKRLDHAKRDILNLESLRDSLSSQANHEEQLKNDYCQLLRAEEERVKALKVSLAESKTFEAKQYDLIQRREDELTKSEKIVASLHEKLNHAKVETDDWRRQNAIREQELEVLRRSNDSLSRHIEELAKARNELVGQLHQARKATGKLFDELLAERCKVAELEKLKNERNESVEEMREAERVIEELRRDFDEMTRIKCGLEVDWQRLQAECEKLRVERATALQNLQAHREEVVKLQKALEVERKRKQESYWKPARTAPVGESIIVVDKAGDVMQYRLATKGSRRSIRKWGPIPK